jgi:hypothetical protein
MRADSTSRVHDLRSRTSKSLPILELLLIIALLLGPCLSMTGFMGAGSAHAHGAVLSNTSQADSASQSHAHHGMQVSIESQQGTSHHPDPATSPPSCEELCENWAVKNSKKDLATTVFNPPNLDHDDASTTALSFDVGLLHLTGHLRRPPLIAYQGASPSSLPAYALTNRFRL